MGFQDMREVVHKAASRKGGSVRKPKGLAKLSPERRKEIAAKGGLTNAQNRRSGNKPKQSQDNRGDDLQLVADILGNLNE